MANFAASGDTFYLTKAQTSSNNFDTSGVNITWNYASLAGSSQRTLVYRLPTQSGYGAAQWPYIYNSNNVNLSSTDNQTTAFFGLQQTNPNDYFLKNNNLLRQKASAYTLVINGTSLNVKNVYSSPDTIYKFPLQYNGVSTSKGAYTTSVPGFYYRSVQIERRDTVKGWGKIITPYATFSNALQLISTVTEIDSVSINGQPAVNNDTIHYREIEWFDPSKKYPVMYARQTKTGNFYVTSAVEYVDVKQYYQPKALFAFIPASPNSGDTVNFQNLSTNAASYKWKFADGTDSSTEINPQHIFTTAGTYPVQLIAYNGTLKDTVTMSIKINPLNQIYTFTGNGNWDVPANWSNSSVPPAVLPATNSIVINPSGGKLCAEYFPAH